MAPLLAWIHANGAESLGAELHQRLGASLQLVSRAVERCQAEPADETRFLLRAAARSTLGEALGKPTNAGANDVAAWLNLIRTQGLPHGHSPTFDAVKLVCLKWVWETTAEAQRTPILSRP